MMKSRLWKALAIFLFISFMVFFTGICLAVFLPQSRETEGEKEKEAMLVEEELREKAVYNAKEMIPEAYQAEEMSEHTSSEHITYSVRDENGEEVAVVTVDRRTGEIYGMMDFRDGGSAGTSMQLNINPDEARAIAEDFLIGNGVDISMYGLTEDPIHIVGYDTTDMDNPKEVYSYDFYYRIQRDGIFVDDWVYGGGWCSVQVSPDDGRIVSFILPKETPLVIDREALEMEIDSEEAVDIAIDEAYQLCGKGAVPIVEGSEIEFRYMTTEEGPLLPYWRIDITFHIPDHDDYKGGCSWVVYCISAVDGKVVLSER
jgi:hypothetical protein